MSKLRRETSECYPLAPMQEGMLFHSLCEPHAGFEIEQLICDLREPLDAAAFRRAWERVIERHAVLRTGFRWEGLSAPMQYVRPEVALPWTEQDWSDLSSQAQEEAFSAFLKNDRARGFPLTEAPLLRLTLFLLGNARFRLVWTFHHALLDGRSFPLVLREVFRLYEALRQGEDLPLPEPPPYRNHIDWLSGRNHDQAEIFWRERLGDFIAPTPLIAGTIARESDGSTRHGVREIALTRSLTQSLQSLAEENELTLNSV